MTEHESAKEIMFETAFLTFCHAEIGSYMIPYAPERVVVSTKEIAHILKWTEYKTRKAIKELVSRGWIERASCGNPAVMSYGETPELMFDAEPPKNGYALTKAGFQTELWKTAYAGWCKSLEEWANKPLEEVIE